MTIKEMMKMYHSLKFVEELIDYIEEYPDDDYMTMECLCRKLHKYGLIDKKDGEWTTDFIERKTEPSNSKIPNNCEPQYDFGEYADRLWKIAYERGKREALEQTEPSCDTCKLKDTTEWCKRQEVCRAYQPKDEPQTENDFTLTYTCSFSDCENFKHFGFGEKCIECKRKQSEVKHKDEPQTERSE